MAKNDASGRNGQNPTESEGIAPKYRRSFGCVTWIYMATLAFLAVISLLLMPLWFFGDWNLFSLIEAPTLAAVILFLPALVGAAVLGARTYRSEKRVATKNGTYIGTIIGWLGYAFIVYLEVQQTGGSVLANLYLPLAFASSVLILYALFSKDNEKGRRAVIVSAGLALVAGLVVLILGGTGLVVIGAIVSTVAGAAAGWTAGFGYARAGGAEMLPPGVTEKPRQPRGNRRPRNAG
ncbi:ECF transporter S component [Rubrobacter indicoceani]|uniref:ECF transporter S component n=1 Tax=Rubrobacter indicoceani TaxID=2051957 RepID=UPI000E5BB27B|nr:ECF transporter S component [Rubrobacter indicoceani]